jgi:hypothetical protein
VVTGLSTEYREVLLTRIMDPEPDYRCELPGPSIWPLVLSLGVGETFIVGIFTPWAFPIGAFMCLVALFGWFWSNCRSEEFKEQPGEDRQRLPLEEARQFPLEEGA